MSTLDDEIARHVEVARATGELRTAQSYGKPLAGREGWDETPEALRMPFKVLKEAGFAPPEIVLFHERAELRALIEATPAGAGRLQLQRKLSELEQAIALRLEALRVNGNL